MGREKCSILMVKYKKVYKNKFYNINNNNNNNNNNDYYLIKRLLEG